MKVPLLNDSWVFACTLGVLFPFVAMAQMSSGSYRIGIDSMNGGGGLSASESYSQESTVGEIATGDSQSETYAMRAGYQQMNSSFISISDGANINLGAMSGITANGAQGDTAWTVITDSPSGYTLGIQATSTPALRNIASTTQVFSDRVYSTTKTPVMDAATGTSEFGFSVSGSHIVNKYRLNSTIDWNDDGNTVQECGLMYAADLSSSYPFHCWDGFSTTTKEIARGGSNHPSGTQTTLRVRASNGPNHLQPSGTYRATLIVTALTL